MAYIGKTPVIGNFVKLDAITAVNGQAAYTMQNGGSNFTDYESVNQFLVSLNGTIQAPTDSFTVSGSTLTFASNLSTGDVINFVIVFGNSLSAGTPTDGTVTNAKLSSGSFSNITGTGTLTNFASTGIDDNGDQTVITIDNQERVGIRETSPISELHITDSSATAVVRLESSDTGDCRINFDDQSATDRGRIIYAHSDDSLRTEVAGSERMRINANGNIMIGNTTESARLHISSSTSAGTDPLIVFSDSGGTDCGSIDLNATANTVAYTTSSDYRLKENVSYDFDATTRLKQFKN